MTGGSEPRIVQRPALGFEVEDVRSGRQLPPEIKKEEDLSPRSPMGYQPPSYPQYCRSPRSSAVGAQSQNSSTLDDRTTGVGQSRFLHRVLEEKKGTVVVGAPIFSRLASPAAPPPLSLDPEGDGCDDRLRAAESRYCQ